MNDAGRGELLGDADYQRLLALRTGIRRFLRWSEEQARTAGLSAAQHQLLLAVRGHLDARGPTIGDLADCLLLRPHSAVSLVDRAQAAGWVYRSPDAQDHRVVRVRLTRAGLELLEQLSARHLAELRRLSGQLGQLWAPPGQVPPPGRVGPPRVPM